MSDFVPDDWEIPFEDISDLQWLGSGAQEAVFVGRFNTELVAVKKVRDSSDTNIHHLHISFSLDTEIAISYEHISS